MKSRSPAGERRRAACVVDSHLEREFAGLEAHNPLVVRWFPVDQLTQVRLYPRVLRTELREIPMTTRHVIHTDEPD